MPGKITIKSDSEVNVDIPWAIEFKWNTTGVAAANFSFAGLAVRLTTANIGLTASKIANNVVVITYNNGLEFKVGSTSYARYLVTLRSAVLTAFN